MTEGSNWFVEPTKHVVVGATYIQLVLSISQGNKEKIVQMFAKIQ